MTSPLIPGLRRIRRRLLLVRAAEAGLLGALAAAPVAALLTVVRILWPQYAPGAAAVPAIPLVLVFCGLLLAFLVRLAWGVSLRQAALAADHAAGLKERLATALEVIEKTGDPARVSSGAGEDRAAPAGSSPSAVHSAPGVPRAALAAGFLDGKLVAQASEAAHGIDPSALRLWRTGGRSARVLLAAALVLLAATLIPSRGGPPVPRAAAERAAEVLGRAAAEGRWMLAPDVRDAVARAAAAIAQPGARRDGADAATAAVFQAAARAEQARRAALEELRKVEDADVQALARAAAQGDAAGAADAGVAAADRLAGPPGAAGAPEADRRRVADGLAGAAQVARREDLPRLAAELQAAAAALRLADAGAARRALQGVASSLAADPDGGPQGVLAAVAEARRAVGLPDVPAPQAGGVSGPPLPAHPGAGEHTQASSGVGMPPVQGQSGGPPPPAAVPAEVRPEDRDVVRRYFGG